MARPELLYFIDETISGWSVRCEDQQYGPYLTLYAAITGAVAEAQAADQAGFSSMVLRRNQDRIFRPCWVLGEEARLSSFSQAGH